MGYNISDNINAETDKLEKTFSYYRRLAYLDKDNFNILNSYIESFAYHIDEFQNKNAFYTEYNNFYELATQKAENIIESLDIVFSNNKKNVDADYDTNYNDNWINFKYSFASSANTLAWSVVENEKDLGLINKAIKWSEASLKLNKNNGYYLDTLAQLYYKNGQKELAIKTQKEAVKAMGDEDMATLQDLKEVLVKMENGTY